MKHLTIHLLAVCLPLCLSQMASGAVHHFRIHKADGSGHYDATAISVGKIPSGEWVLVTAGHNFGRPGNRERVNPGIGISRKFVPVTLRHHAWNDQTGDDFAICTFRDDSGTFDCSPLADSDAKAGDTVQSVAVDHRGKAPSTFIRINGTVITGQFREFGRTTKDGGSYFQGMSGGAVVNADHKVCGVIVQHTDHSNHMTNIGKVRKVMLGIFGRCPT